MLKRNASQLVLLLLFAALLTHAFNTRPAIASGTIYIRADGSIDPPTAPILRSGNVYALTDDISGSIIVEKDNIVVNGAGHTLQGTGEETGIDLSLRTNEKIQNIIIKTFNYAVYLSSSSHVTISGTNIANSSDGIWLSHSSSNSIFGNNITTNVLEGIYILDSTGNSIFGNNITTNTFDGIYLFSSSNNTISGNKIANNGYGVTSYYSSDNNIFHNNFISNFEQAHSESSIDTWDNAYPSGGNYWNNYTGVDKECGPEQDHPGSDGMGDSSYAIDSSNQDNYPLMKPWTPPLGHNVVVICVVSSKTVIEQGFTCNITAYGANIGAYSETFEVTAYSNTTAVASTTVALQSDFTTTLTFSWNTANSSKGNYRISAYATIVPGETDTTDNNFTAGWVILTISGDLNGDYTVGLADLVILAKAYGSKPRDPNWNPNADMDDNGIVGLSDLVIMAIHYGQHYP
jgi:parallel beta-helix repeat protein